MHFHYELISTFIYSFSEQRFVPLAYLSYVNISDSHKKVHIKIQEFLSIKSNL